MKPIRHILTAVATALVMAAGALAAPAVQAAERLNPFRPLDGVYYSAEASGTALNWTHIRTNLYFGVVNEYDFEGSGDSRWYTFTMELNYNDVNDFAKTYPYPVQSTYGEAAGTIADVARPYERLNNPVSESVIAYGTGELIVSTRPPGEPHESHLTGVDVEMKFYSSSVVDVTYGGKTSRFRAVPGEPAFTVTDDLDKSPYEMRGSRSWEANPNYGNTIPGVPPVIDNNPGEVIEGFIDELSADWLVAGADQGWPIQDDERGAKLFLFNGYPLPPEVPMAQKEPGSYLFNYTEYLFPGITDQGFNVNAGTIGIFWDPELDRGFAYDMSASPVDGYSTYERGVYLGIVLRTLAGFRIVNVDSYQEAQALANDGDPKTNPDGRYLFIDLTRY